MVKNYDFKPISIRKETYKRLVEIRKEHWHLTWDDIINALIIEAQENNETTSPTEQQPQTPSEEQTNA